MDKQSTERLESRWARLYEVASAQEGHFTTAQAAIAGYSPQLLNKYLKSGRIERLRRGIYRLAHFPPGDHEDLVVLWLWSERVGVFSHETALALHQLSDVLPAKVHLTVPCSWKSRRVQVPTGVVLHLADLPEDDRTWMGPVVVTSPARTVVDCAAAHLSPEIVGQAVDQGLRRGVFTEGMVEPAITYLQAGDKNG